MANNEEEKDCFLDKLRWKQSIFDNDFITLHTRCIAEAQIVKEQHVKFNHISN